MAYSFATLKEGMTSLISASKSMRNAYQRITVITLATIVSSDSERESVGIKSTSEGALRKFFYDKLALDSKSSEARSIRNAISRAVGLAAHVERAPLMGANSFGMVCELCEQQLKTIEAAKALESQNKADEQKAKREEVKAEKAAEAVSVQALEHTATELQARFKVEAAPDWSDEERIAAIIAEMKLVSSDKLAIIAAAINAEMRVRMSVQQSEALAA